MQIQIYRCSQLNHIPQLGIETAFWKTEYITMFTGSSQDEAKLIKQSQLDSTTMNFSNICYTFYLRIPATMMSGKTHTLVRRKNTPIRRTQFGL